MSTEAVQAVDVALGARSYPIYIGRGVLAQCGAHLARLAPGGRIAIVTDAHVEGILRADVSA
ncbi:MAG: hypothetical protein ACRCYS_08965, partial [Beijerinckiaceae bacterium]